MQMSTDAWQEKRGELTAEVRQLVTGRLAGVTSIIGSAARDEQLPPGKMLRTRLAARLAEAGPPPGGPLLLGRACAATELAHTASLCHDDVIDNAVIRRARPALWREFGSTSAVLVGDVLLCEAMSLILEIEDARYTRAFVDKLREVCIAETEHELRFRGTRLDEETCLRLARGKTGPLFAFVASVCGGDDEELSAALEEAGYRIGTAYQLADDILDVVGDEAVAGKTLHADVARRKFTLPQTPEDGLHSARERIERLCASACEELADWPDIQAALAGFFRDDLHAVFAACDVSTELYCLKPSL